MSTKAEREMSALQKGRLAYSRGKRLADNPYTHETSTQSAYCRAWSQGWRTAVENDPLLDRDEKDELIRSPR